MACQCVPSLSGVGPFTTLSTVETLEQVRWKTEAVLNIIELDDAGRDQFRFQNAAIRKVQFMELLLCADNIEQHAIVLLTLKHNSDRCFGHGAPRFPLVPSCSSSPARDLTALIRGERIRTGASPGLTGPHLRRLLVGCLLDLASGDLRDVDGASYHVSRSLLALRPLGHG